MARAERLPQDEREKCKAHSKQSGKRCERWPARGFTICATHGARAPQVKNKAAERVLEAKINEAVTKLNITPIGDPLTALNQLAAEILAWKDTLREKAKALGDRLRYQSDIGTEQLRAELVLYERALDRAVAVLGVIAKLNIDERLAAIEESQAKRIEDGLFAAFEEAGLTMRDAEMKERIAKTFTRHLSLVS